MRFFFSRVVPRAAPLLPHFTRLPPFLSASHSRQHIPHGFYESQLRGYLSQFGDVRHVYLSRSRKTARSRGYAFVQFRDALVARIASEALNGYPLGGKVVRSSVVDPAKAHPSMFADADRKWRKIPWRTVIREAQAAPRTAEQVRSRQAQSIRRESKAAAKRLKAGIDLKFPSSFVALAAAGGGVAAAAAIAPPAAKEASAALTSGVIAKKRKRSEDDAAESHAAPPYAKRAPAVAPPAIIAVESTAKPAAVKKTVAAAAKVPPPPAAATATKAAAPVAAAPAAAAPAKGKKTPAAAPVKEKKSAPPPAAANLKDKKAADKKAVDTVRTAAVAVRRGKGAR